MINENRKAGIVLQIYDQDCLENTVQYETTMLKSSLAWYILSSNRCFQERKKHSFIIHVSFRALQEELFDEKHPTVEQQM